jgi:inner membrane protein
MPTIFSHVVAATALGQFYPERHLPARFWLWTVVCAILPDVDVIGFALGIRYDDMLGHRGLTHSLAFAALTGAVAAVTYRRGSPDGTEPVPLPSTSFPLMLFFYFAAIVASHGLLDAFTNGGRGIAFLAPFSNHRFFFPWRPIQVSPIGVGFFTTRGLAALDSELRWILLPSVIIALLARIRGRPAGRSSRSPASEGG